MPISSKEHPSASQEALQRETLRLLPSQPLVLDPRHPLEELPTFSVLAEIQVGKHTFQLYDLNKSKEARPTPYDRRNLFIFRPFEEGAPFTSRFILVNEQFDPRDLLSKDFLEIDSYTPVGRKHIPPDTLFGEDFEVSYEHFALQNSGGGVTIMDLDSHTGTKVTAYFNTDNPHYRAFFDGSAQQPALHAPENTAKTRQRQIAALAPLLGKVITEYEARYTDLSIPEMAQIIETITNLRRSGVSDKKAYIELAKRYHPDRLTDMDETERHTAETKSKFLNDLYDRTTNSFRLQS